MKIFNPLFKQENFDYQETIKVPNFVVGSLSLHEIKLTGDILCNLVKSICKELAAFMLLYPQQDYTLIEVYSNNIRIIPLYQKEIILEEGEGAFIESLNIKKLSGFLNKRIFMLPKDFIIACDLGLPLSSIILSLVPFKDNNYTYLIYGKYFTNNSEFISHNRYVKVIYNSVIVNCLATVFQTLILNNIDMFVENQNGNVFIIYIKEDTVSVFAKNIAWYNIIMIGEIGLSDEDCFVTIIDFMKGKSYSVCRVLCKELNINYYLS